MRWRLASYRWIERQRHRTARSIAARLSLAIRRAAPARLSYPDGTPGIAHGIDRLAVQLWPHFQPDRDRHCATPAEILAERVSRSGCQYGTREPPRSWNLLK